jgi:hypothetical protein
MVQTGLDARRQAQVPGTPGEIKHEGGREQAVRRVSQPRRTNLRDVLARQGSELT